MPQIARMLACLAALLVAVLAAVPAHAAYCDSFGADVPRFPDGPCDFVHEASTAWGGGTSRISLLIETEARRGVPPARVAELKRMVDEVAAAAGPALARMGGVRLPATVHIVVVNDRVAADTYAETLRRVDGSGDCPMLLFNSAAGAGIGRLARTVAHELFHCAQYETWPAKTGPEVTRWWTEGSAEWFEDFALPGRLADSDLAVAVQRFRERAGTYSLLDNTYGNAVLFAWLGPRRVALYISALSDAGEPQLAGAARAMDGMDYQRFAQDYIDERIRFPSGLSVAGAEFVPPLAVLHTTTGRPGEDPPWEAPAVVRPLTLTFGTIDFVPADYAPQGVFGTRRAVFSERAGTWGNMPNPLRVNCEGIKKIRFVGLAVAEARLRVDPGTRSAGSRDCRCPVGNWTIPEDRLMDFSPHPRADLISRGDVTMRFSPDGTARFSARSLAFRLPTRTTGRGGAAISVSVVITRSYEGTWRWTTSGDRITMYAIDLMTTTERSTHSVSGPPPLSGTHAQPARVRTIESDNHDGRAKQFSCEGDQLIITEPLDRVGVDRWRVPSMNLTRYPRSGIFVRN